MRIIKPGKVAPKPARSSTGAISKSSAQPLPLEVWDDFAQGKKQKKKKEYERGSGTQMLPRILELKPEQRPENGATPEGELGASAEPFRFSQGQKFDYSSLETRLSYSFTDITLLERALTHRSALGLTERTDYERLEFLGDAVIDLSVAHLLSDRHPEAREGELSKMRAALVNTQALAGIAKTLELGPYIRLGRGEFSSGGNERPSILADVVEAVIGAIYRDSSYDRAMVVIEGIFGALLEKVTPFDPKTELQEVLHASGSEPPQYLLEMVEGPEHAPTFVTVVLVDNEVAGRGRGSTKKGAQQAAAAEAIHKLFADEFSVQLAEGQRFIIADFLNGPRRPAYDPAQLEMLIGGGGFGD